MHRLVVLLQVVCVLCHLDLLCLLLHPFLPSGALRIQKVLSLSLCLNGMSVKGKEGEGEGEESTGFLF